MRDRSVELPLLKGKPKEKYIPISIIIGTVGILVLLLIASLAFTFKSTYKLHYSEKSYIDYKIYLTDENVYGKKYIGKNDNLKPVASLINNIDTTMDYTFKSDEKIGIKYTYYVVAKVEVNDSQGETLFKKEDILVKKKTLEEAESDTFKVSEKASVDYAKYNKIASEFVDKYKLTANSKLTVSLIVDIEGKHTNFDNKLNDKEVVSFSIPLTEKTASISPDYNMSNNADAVLQYKSVILKNRVLLFITLLFMIIDVVAIVYIIVWVIINRDAQTLYNRKLDRILKDYNRYISETVITERVEDMMVTRSLRIEVIKKFEDLLDIRDALNKPILYHEERPNEEAVFYILTERIGYIYVMRRDDFIKKNEEVQEVKKTNRTHKSKKRLNKK